MSFHRGRWRSSWWEPSTVKCSATRLRSLTFMPSNWPSRAALWRKESVCGFKFSWRASSFIEYWQKLSKQFSKILKTWPLFCRLSGCVSVPERESRVASSSGEHCIEGECKIFAPLISGCLTELCWCVLCFLPCQDLQSTNLIEVCMALTVVGQIFPKDMIPAILPLVEEKLNHPKYEMPLLIYHIKHTLAHKLQLNI